MLFFSQVISEKRKKVRVDVTTLCHLLTIKTFNFRRLMNCKNILIINGFLYKNNENEKNI